MQKKIIFYTLTALMSVSATDLFCSAFAPKQSYTFVESYKKPADVSIETWNAVLPYLLPSNHPSKAKLDAIFRSRRAIASSRELKAAGFTPLEDKELDLIVAKHPEIPGFLIKTYYDNHRIPNRAGVPGEAQYWINRIIGVDRVRESIRKNNLGDMFLAPNKWIYPLPDNPAPQCKGAPNCFPKHFILVSEELDLVSPAENAKLYKEKMTPYLLNGLYTIMKDTHLYDSVYIDNNIFTKDGRIAFIDTEDLDRKPILFNEMTVYFSPEMQRCWHELLQERGGTIPARVQCIN